MDISNLSSTRQVLREASYKFLLPLNDGTKMFYGRKKAAIPGVIFKPADGNTIRDSNHIFSVVVNNAAGTKLWNKIVQDNQSGTVNQGSPEHEFLQLWSNIGNARQDSVDLRAMSQFPGVFKVAELYGRDRIFKYITTDLRMPQQVFVKHFGEVPDMGEEHFVKFHDARVFIPDNARAASKKAMMNVLETLFQHLRANGFGFLFHGDIRFIQLVGNRIGTYNVITKEMNIVPKVKNSKEVIYTLLHEFAHKYWFEYMDQEARVKVRQKFGELMRGDTRHKADTSSHDATIADLRANLEPGMQLDYTGRKRDFKRYSPFVIKEITKDGFLRLASVADEMEFVRVKAPIAALLTNRWSVPSLEEGGFEKPEPLTKYDMESDQWFPTKYSMVEDEEWFAEIMAFFLLDHLHGEPEEFLHEVFGV